MPNEQSYPAGMYWVWTRQLGFIGRNEARGESDHLDGQVLFLKSLVAEELEESSKHLKAWQLASQKVAKASGNAGRREARLEQLEVLVSLAKRIGILADRDLERFDLEAFEGGAYNVGEEDG